MLYQTRLQRPTRKEKKQAACGICPHARLFLADR
jgi:hypothetical protein